MIRVVALLLIISNVINACTLIVVGRNASTDGSVLIAHTDDAGGGTSDLRLARIHPAEHPEGSMRPIYNFANGYPRVVSKERGSIYMPAQGQELFTPLGYIPQVRKTHGYFDQDYGLMNDVQLSIGESSCGARTLGWSSDRPYGKNMFSIAELTRVALERCDSARCAVQTMGDLATTYGFYGEDSGTPTRPGYGGSAETVAVGDKYGEAWMFHVLTSTDGSGAIWAAKRVADDEVAVCPNGFVIRELELDNKDWYLASENVHSEAIKMGWWKPESGAFDFTAAYSFSGGDAVGAYYLGRRTWRIQDLVAPSLKLSPYLGAVPSPKTYAFSVKPDKLIDLPFLFSILRDHYEGTEFDLTKGLGAGPFGNPNRYDTPNYGVKGGWERPIAIYRATFSFVCQSRPALPDQVGGVFWFAHDNPTGSLYIPFYGAQTSVPASYLNCKQSVFSRGCAWWAFNFVNNWITLRYSSMIIDVKAKQHELETEALAAQQDVEKRALTHSDKKEMLRVVEQHSIAQAEKFVDAYWSFADGLIAKFSNGYITTGEKPSEQKFLGYNAPWLQATEYKGWPHHPLPGWLGSQYYTPTAPLPATLNTTTNTWVPTSAADLESLAMQMPSGIRYNEDVGSATLFILLGVLLGCAGTALVCFLLLGADAKSRATFLPSAYSTPPTFSASRAGPNYNTL